MSFDLQPTLKGNLLELRPLRREDFEELFAVAADPLIWEQHPASDRYQPAVFRAFFDEAIASRGALLALDTKSGRVIGSSRFHAYDAARREVEIGWTFLARSHWGGRYNCEMKHLMLEHAFRFVDRVVFVVGIHNLRSQRVSILATFPPPVLVISPPPPVDSSWSYLEGQKTTTDQLRRQGRICPWVFHRNGRRIKSYDASWRAAYKAAGLPGRIVHDFRRTAVCHRTLKSGQ